MGLPIENQSWACRTSHDVVGSCSGGWELIGAGFTVGATPTMDLGLVWAATGCKRRVGPEMTGRFKRGDSLGRSGWTRWEVIFRWKSKLAWANFKTFELREGENLEQNSIGR